MKRAAAAMLAAVLLAGCSGVPKEMERGLALRTKLLSAGECSFDGEITADYGDKLYTFSLSCVGDSKGAVRFLVTQPEAISGITGVLDSDDGALTFGDTVLAFPMLAGGQLSPVSTPWLFLKTLRGGYITSAGMEGEYLRLSIDDSYAEDALHLDIWLDGDDVPVRTEVRFRERKILSMNVSNFRME